MQTLKKSNNLRCIPKLSNVIILTFSFIIIASCAFAQKDWNHVGIDDAVTVDTLKKDKFTLVFINKDAGFSEDVKNRLIDVFFTNYPKEVKLYNKNATKKVVFIIDPEYTGVAAAGGGIVRFNPEWFKKNPGDVDVVTHEVMHLVQNYPNGAGPGWITEGIADYVRFTLGVDNEGANWTLTEFDQKQSYKNAYRITARFFYWIEKNVKKGSVKKLDNAMRTKTYTESFWKDNIGKDLDELWADYEKNPEIN